MALSLTELDFIRVLLQQRSGIVLDREKHYLIEVRLGALARREGFPSVDDMVGELRRGDTRLELRIVEALTTNETFFFRDIHPFDGLRDVIFPNLFTRRLAERSLRIWCAACLTAQEPYGVAMLLRDYFPCLRDWCVKILATDLSGEMVERARQGRYTALEVSRGLSPVLLARHFHQQGSVWLLKDEVRRMVEFRQMNLFDSWGGLPSFDLVLLRNVLIYFDLEGKRSILRKVPQVLRPDGYLLLGSTETTLNIEEGFEPTPMEKTTCYRRTGWRGEPRSSLCVGVNRAASPERS